MTWFQSIRFDRALHAKNRETQKPCAKMLLKITSFFSEKFDFFSKKNEKIQEKCVLYCKNIYIDVLDLIINDLKIFHCMTLFAVRSGSDDGNHVFIISFNVIDYSLICTAALFPIIG